MFTSVRATAQRQQGPSISMTAPQFRKGFEIPLLPYQTYGILSKVLWTSKNHIIRIIPGYDKQTGEVFRQNIRCNEYSPDDAYENYLSGTFCMASIVERFGTLTAPFISDYRPGSPDEQAYAGETVLRNFIRGIMYASNGKGRARLKPINEWKAWTTPGPAATMSYDHQGLLMQTLAFHVNGRNNQDLDTHQDMLDQDGDVLPLLMLCAVTGKKSVGDIMQALVDPMNPGMPLDAASNNKYGPMAELDGNKLFLNTYNDPQTHYAALRPSVQAPGPGWNPTPFPLDEEAVHQLWHPWEDLLYYMDAQEQLALCAREFGKDTVNYVIGTDPKFSGLTIPDDIRQAGLGRYASLAGGSVSYETTQYSQSAPRSEVIPGNIGRSIGRGLSQQPAYQPPAQPAAPAAPAKPAFGKPAASVRSAVPAGSGVNVQQVMDQVQAIRAAAHMAPVPRPDAQADAAASLLGEDGTMEA